MVEGIWTMTESEFTEALRSAKEQAWDEGWDAAAGWPQIDDNPYKEDGKPAEDDIKDMRKQAAEFRANQVRRQREVRAFRSRLSELRRNERRAQ